MSKCKLVPVEPTPEMIDAAAEAYMPFGDMDIALRMALLEAPAVQVEISRKEMDKEFSEWCQRNRSLVLDCRLHTHAGPIDRGGYISDEKTRIAFAAYRAGRLAAPQPTP